ncbi:uncharacterized protein LOC115638345 [Gopherus evgoodei]|uniref:uncharacterized protein LOC115638345 n=1 Tax=Gopherus evgoodei TaxID=1825980 RepID=UPI0011CF2434|nr:uncharacterized protein LOC115638345 [Gopherus evgoodei]
MGFCFLKAGEQVACTRQALEDSQSYQIGRLGMEDSGSYTCMYRVAEPGQEISSLESQPISIRVTGVPLPLPAPQIILDPPKHIYFHREHVKITCSVPGIEQLRGYRFYHRRGEQISELDEGAWLERMAMTGNAGAYSCAYWITRSGQVILSGKSDSISITVSAPPLAPKLSLHPKLPVYLPGEKPGLSMDPPSRVVSEGFPLFITCTAPKDANKRRFHFYKDAVKLIPTDVGSEISTMEHGTGFMNVSVLGLPWAGPERTGEFTCGRRKGGVVAETHPHYVNRPSSTGTVLQQWSHDGQLQPVTHNHPALPNNPRGKPRVGRNPQKRGKREEDADARVECNSLVSNPVYSMLNPSSAVAQQRGGKYVSEAVVYSEILH